jgi:hypothetical protein
MQLIKSLSKLLFREEKKDLHSKIFLQIDRFVLTKGNWDSSHGFPILCEAKWLLD